MSLGDMDREIWSCFPDDLFMNFMAFLPLRSLLRFRTVSKKWNAVPKDPNFHQMRDTFYHEFITEVLGCQRLRRTGYVLTSTNGFMLVINRSNFHEIYVMRASMAYLRQIPPPEWSLQVTKFNFELQLKKFNFEVVGMAVDGDTKDYTIVVSSILTDSLSRDVVRQGGAQWELDKWTNLHLFESATGVWSWCGNGGMILYQGQLISVVMHRRRVLVVVRCYTHYQIQCYNGSCSWETLPGKIGKCPYSGHEIPKLFDHNGKLRLAVPHLSGCYLWEYDDDSSEWTPMHLLPNTGYYHTSLDRELVYSVAFDYCAVAGGFLYFGILSYQGETTMCRRMKYNLTTRVLERMCRDEEEKISVKDRSRRLRFYFEAA